MGLFRRTTSARSAYTTEPTTDPETDQLAAQWDQLNRR